MKRLLFATLLLLVPCGRSYAVTGDTTHCSLEFRSGAGCGIYRDMGVSPLTYRGLELHPGISLVVENGRWLHQPFLSLHGGGFGLRYGLKYMQAYGGSAVVGYRLWRNLHSSNHWRLWLGASIDNLFDVRYNGSLGNSAACFGNFVRLNAECSVQYFLDRWMFHGGLSFNTLAVAFRPGFAYMDNFDQDISSPTANTFDQYRAYPLLASGAETSLGASLLLRNSNRIDLSYHWGYLTSRSTLDGVTAPHLFEQASHALLLTFRFNLS